MGVREFNQNTIDDELKYFIDETSKHINHDMLYVDMINRNVMTEVVMAMSMIFWCHVNYTPCVYNTRPADLYNNDMSEDILKNSLLALHRLCTCDSSEIDLDGQDRILNELSDSQIIMIADEVVNAGFNKIKALLEDKLNSVEAVYMAGMRIAVIISNDETRKFFDSMFFDYVRKYIPNAECKVSPEYYTVGMLRYMAENNIDINRPWADLDCEKEIVEEFRKALKAQGLV